ncbi:MAG: hypothetical protein NTY48_02780, partial [Candidatus Diapherotrites archaeon]|nr:hypothetical protein [Candidatus Diapherotrites archaeon]
MDSNKFPLIPGAGLDSANINNPDLSPVIGLDSAKPVSSEKLVSAQIIPPAIPIPSSTTLFVASLPSQLPEKIEKIALVYSALDKAGMLIFEEIKKIGLPDWAVP